MKIGLIIVGVLCFICFSFFVLPRTDYQLSIQKGKVVKEGIQTYWEMPVTLFNNTTDTLRYFTMSCSWQSFYEVDNSKLKIEPIWCDKDIPQILVLGPGKKQPIKIRLLISQTMDASEIKFRIGFNLMKVTKDQNTLDFDHEEERKKKNVIWSNTISM
jgi:hypothetical protein